MKSYDYYEAIMSSDLSSNAKLTALAISYHYNWREGNKAFPSINLLTQRTSLSKATIHRAKNELVSRGFLEIKRRFNKSNLYLPVIPTQSQTETLVVSERRTNNEYNYEVNYEDASLHSASLDINNINQEEVVLLEETEIWRLFENEERNTRLQPARRSNKSAGRSNKEIRRNNPDSTEVAGFLQELAKARKTDWMG